MSITESGSPNPVAGGGTITYTLVVTNNGPSTASAVTLTDPLPDTYVSSSSTVGSCSVTKSKGKAILDCSLGTMTSGTSATVTLQVKAPHKKGTTSNTASVKASETDPNTGNNSATAVVTIQ
jgi:uncharacterized repeat protein (TIGR01451 family)